MICISRMICTYIYAIYKYMLHILIERNSPLPFQQCTSLLASSPAPMRRAGISTTPPAGGEGRGNLYNSQLQQLNTYVNIRLYIIHISRSTIYKHINLRIKTHFSQLWESIHISQQGESLHLNQIYGAIFQLYSTTQSFWSPQQILCKTYSQRDRMPPFYLYNKKPLPDYCALHTVCAHVCPLIRQKSF